MDEKRFDEYDEFPSERGLTSEDYDDYPLVRGFGGDDYDTFSLTRDDDSPLTSDFSGGSSGWGEEAPLTSDFSGGGSGWDDDSPLTSDFSRGGSGWDEDAPLTSDFSGGGSGWDEDAPLTSDFSGGDSDWQREEPAGGEFDTRRVVRPTGRRETIERVASDHKKGIVRTPGMRTQPDPRLAASRLGKLGDPYAKKQAPRRNAPRGNGSPRQGSGASHHGGRGGVSPPPPSAYKRRKTIFAAFYIVLILVAVGVCVTVFLMVFQSVVDSPPQMGVVMGAPPTPTPTPGISTVDRADIRNQTALVTNIDPLGDVRTVTLMDVGTRRFEDFIVPDDARISNRNMPMAFAELRVGHIVDIGFDIRTSEIMNLSISRDSWERRARTNVQIDLEDALITLGTETFSFNSQTLVLHRGEQFSISQIRPIDSVTLAGIDDTVWLVQLDAAHGFLQFTNTDLVINGTLRVGTSRFYRLADIEGTLELPEGTHQLVIEGSNIEQFITTVTIEQGQTEVLNLGTSVELRAAFLYVNVTPSDATIIINGQVHDQTDGPAHVEFGDVRVRVERDGFVPSEQQMEITMPINNIVFNLMEIVVDSILVITTAPSNAQVFVDNVFVGYAPVSHVLEPGFYRVIARLPGFEDTNINVTVPAGETFEQHLLLTVASNQHDHWIPPTPEPTPTPPGQPPVGYPLPEIPDDNPFPNSPELPAPDVIHQPVNPNELPTHPPVEFPVNQIPVPTPTPPNDVIPPRPPDWPLDLPWPPPVDVGSLPEVSTDNPFAGGSGTP